jgi:hypothetical protein
VAAAAGYGALKAVWETVVLGLAFGSPAWVTRRR